MVGIFGIALVMITIFVACLIFAERIPCIEKSCSGCISSLKKKLMWNVVIASIMFSFISLFYAAFKGLENLWKDDGSLSSGLIASSILLVGLIFVIPTTVKVASTPQIVFYTEEFS